MLCGDLHEPYSMKKRSFFAFLTLVLVLGVRTKVEGQVVLESIKQFETILDSARFQSISQYLNISSATQTMDTVVGGFYNPESYTFDLVYPPLHLNAESRVPNILPIEPGSGFYRQNLSPAPPPQIGSAFVMNSITIYDEELREVAEVTLDIDHSYSYKGDVLHTNIVADPHDVKVLVKEGVTYVVWIGKRLQWYNATEWINEDSLTVQFTSIHITDIEGNVVANFFPHESGSMPFEQYRTTTYLQATTEGIRYNFPHINVLDVNVDGIAYSSRHPGHISYIDWSAPYSLVMKWIIGNEPNYPGGFYLPTITSNMLSTNHGCGLLERNDSIFVATFNNNGLDPQIGSRHQVYFVDESEAEAEMIWESPNIQFSSCCRGLAAWSTSGELAAVYGSRGGVVTGYDQDNNPIYGSDHPDVIVWDPFSDLKIAEWKLPGDPGLVSWISDQHILDVGTKQIVTSDSVYCNYLGPYDLSYWKVGDETFFDEQLVLQQTYQDSVEVISPFVQSGTIGTWRVVESSVPVGVQHTAQNNELILAPNPVRHMVNVSGTYLKDGGVYQLFNSQGELVQKGILTAQIDLSGQPAGLYIFVVGTTNRKLLKL